MPQTCVDEKTYGKSMTTKELLAHIPGMRHAESDCFFLLAGPCVIESEEMALRIAEKVCGITDRLGIPYVFKGSYKKANRSRIDSFTGIGDEKALKILDKVRRSFGVPVVTDIHESPDAQRAAEYVDVLQIPAFLVRQTDLVVAAARTGKPVNLKKGQFMAPDAMEFAVQKVLDAGNPCAMVTDRGTMFGYRDLIVDFTGIPVMKRYGALYDDQQCSSYDVESCGWSNIPDVDLALAEDCSWILGQFVWTGFDYLGEPSPYGTDSWPNHSSMFGIIDLASIPKDRYWLYRSVWNDRESTLHILPHWNWEGREGENIPVFVYTSWPEAELFLNGKSLGRQKKGPDGYVVPVDTVAVSLYTSYAGTLGDVNAPVESRFRLMWPDVEYEPGEIRVVAYDASGNVAESRTVRTAGEPCRLLLETDRTSLVADGKDLAYVTVSAVDRDGNFCPLDDRLVKFNVSGAGTFKASANGDPTSLDPFHIPQMHLFNGKLTVIVCSSGEEGRLTLDVSAEGLETSSIALDVRKPESTSR